jgi:hypothetical protein
MGVRKIVQPREGEPSAIDPLVWRLLRPYEEYVGPNTFVMRLAFWSAVGGRDFDVDAVIAAHADYLNKQPEHAATRANLVSACWWIRWKTPPAPVWLLPGRLWFDPSQWFTGAPPGGKADL